MIILFPRNQLGGVIPEGWTVQTEQEAWKQAANFLSKNEQVVYITLHNVDMTLINELWKTEHYKGWKKG